MADEFHVEPDLEAPPPPLGPPTENVCDVCGLVFKNEHGVTMHKARIHNPNVSKWGPGRPSKRTGKRPGRPRKVSNPETTFQIVLKEAWSDKNGRILLTDQDGNWWVARKLDV